MDWHTPAGAKQKVFGGVLQTTVAPAVQTPAWQLSLLVQPLLSALQLVPSVAAGFEQVPVFGSQVPTTWH